MLVMAGARTEEVAELVVSATEPSGGSGAFEAPHGSIATFDAAVILLHPVQPVDEVLVQSERRSKRMFKMIRAGMALWATRTIRMAASAAPSLIGSRISTHQPRATASFGVPAPINRRMSSPRLCPATWIR